MDNKGKIVEISGKKVYLVKGIYYFFNESNFERLLQEHRQASNYNVPFYVGLYSNELVERVTGMKEYRKKISDNDRVNMLEALDFVDGAFIINSLDKDYITSSLALRLLKDREQGSNIHEVKTKKYNIGYASGAFSNLHKGHIEHLKEMKKQCKTTIVAANSDELIQKYKNKTSSVNEKARRKILSHIKYVDVAIITHEYDKLKALEKVKELCGSYFDAIFVGSDWKGNSNWEQFEKKLNTMGIDVVFTDRPEKGISTTDIDKGNRKRTVIDNADR